MKAKEAYQTAHNKKAAFTLRAKLTVFVTGVVLISILIFTWIADLLEQAIPALADIPDLLQVCVLSLIIAAVTARFISRIFCDPIQDMLSGMAKVATGDFTVQLQTKSTAKEVQEMIAGFNLMTRELQSTETVQTDFISNVSHEFKTPINAIEGYTTLLQGTDNIDEVEAAYIEKILHSTRRLSSLVNNILLLSKVENQHIPPVKKTFALDEQIRTAILDLEAAWSAKDIELDMDFDSVVYYGDEKKMYHVWSNLIGNAVKFSPQGGCIKIRLHQKEKNIVFTVEDQGPGISQDAMKHLFEKFYQADASREQEGNGLGLALVKRILTVAGGEVTAKNLPQGGCRFTVVLKADTAQS